MYRQIISKSLILKPKSAWAAIFRFEALVTG